MTGRATRGIYEQIHPNVYGFAGSETSWRREVLAAVLSENVPSAASHKTASFLWGMTDDRPERIEIVTRRHHRLLRVPYEVHESKDLIEADIDFLDGIRVTTPARTLVDLGASTRLGIVARCFDTALRTKLVTVAEVDRLLRRVARKGRTGVGTIRPLLEERMQWQSVTESSLEDRFRALIDRAGLPVPSVQYRLTDGDRFVGRYDFAYEECRTLIELDSVAYHMDPESFQRDREKQTRAQMLGWTVYRFTSKDLTAQPDRVISVLALILATCGQNQRQNGD